MDHVATIQCMPPLKTYSIVGPQLIIGKAKKGVLCRMNPCSIMAYNFLSGYLSWNHNRIQRPDKKVANHMERIKPQGGVPGK